MFIVSFKTSKSVIAGFLCVISCLAASAVMLVNHSSWDIAVPSGEQTAEAVTYPAKSNAERLEFLVSYGWKTEDTPAYTEEVKIPENFDRTMADYNNIQLAQGFDLSRFCGKRLMKYSYKVTNYPGIPEGVYADIYVYKDNIVAGDICNSAIDGFIKGFKNDL